MSVVQCRLNHNDFKKKIMSVIVYHNASRVENADTAKLISHFEIIGIVLWKAESNICRNICPDIILPSSETVVVESNSWRRIFDNFKNHDNISLK